MLGPNTLVRRAVGEWVLHSDSDHGNPFTDVVVEARFQAPSGQEWRMLAFYDGEGTWRVRFSPDQEGQWAIRVVSVPADRALQAEAAFTVTPSEARGFLRSTPGDAWGFQYESGEPAFILGDTTYNLFGMAHCGGDVSGFLQRRAAQRFNLLRVRLQVSPFHPPRGYSDWQTQRTWPWGGSEQAPQFDRFNLDWFATVDRVVQEAETLGVGLELIMEAWGFEWPFAHRDEFLPEWEELWMRYLVARYDAYSSVAFWTLQNEYEFYPDGDWRYNRVADLWAIRMGRWLKQTAPHGHIVAIHNGPRLPPFAQRFAVGPDAIDAVMFQEWGSRDEAKGWLADGIEGVIDAALEGWWGSAVFAEWGYERNPALAPNVPSHIYCDEDHTRRGAWRGAFRALGIIHGFENSWGPWMLLEDDQPGLQHLLQVRRFFTEVLPFADLRPADEIVVAGPGEAGYRALALSSADGRKVAVYLPAGGTVALRLALPSSAYRAEWFDPCSGELRLAEALSGGYTSPDVERSSPTHRRPLPQDWVLVLRPR